MRITDRSLWTAPPPNAVRQATAQPVGEPGLATYYYFLVAHYPIGNVISQPFAAYRAPNTLDANNYVFLSWEAASTATSYDILRTETLPLPTDGSIPTALALGLTGTTYSDQGAALTPYNFSGLMNGSTVDAWALLNNKDYSKPILEFSPTVRISSILFADGSELATATGGGSAAVGSINGLQGVITIAGAAPNTAVTQAGQTITIRAQPTGAAGQVQFNAGGVPPVAGASANLFWDNANGRLGINQPNPQSTLDIIGPWTSGVEGPARITGSVGTCYLTLNTTTAPGYSAIMFMNAGVYRGEIGGDPDGLGIYTIGPGASVWIATNGNVGIGASLAAAPQHALDVAGSVNCTGNYLINGVPAGSQIPATGTAPASPQNGQLWYDTSVLRLKIWLGTWVQIA